LTGANHIYTDAPRSFLPRTKYEKFVAASPEDPLKSGIGSLLRIFGEGEGGKWKGIRPLKTLMSKVRVVKSDAEISNMRMAGQRSGRAITQAMRSAWPEERHLHNYLDYQFRVNGCDREAYVPVIAGGRNLRGIHYTMNDQKIEYARQVQDSLYADSSDLTT
jgi:intermediate cleaving peptidase 55